jgi:hypothetical protein
MGIPSNVLIFMNFKLLTREYSKTLQERKTGDHCSVREDVNIQALLWLNVITSRNDS